MDLKLKGFLLIHQICPILIMDLQGCCGVKSVTGDILKIVVEEDVMFVGE